MEGIGPPQIRSVPGDYEYLLICVRTPLQRRHSAGLPEVLVSYRHVAVSTLTCAPVVSSSSAQGGRTRKNLEPAWRRHT